MAMVNMVPISSQQTNGLKSGVSTLSKGEHTNRDQDRSPSFPDLFSQLFGQQQTVMLEGMSNQVDQSQDQSRFEEDGSLSSEKINLEELLLNLAMALDGENKVIDDETSLAELLQQLEESGGLDDLYKVLFEQDGDQTRFINLLQTVAASAAQTESAPLLTLLQRWLGIQQVSNQPNPLIAAQLEGDMSDLSMPSLQDRSTDQGSNPGSSATAHNGPNGGLLNTLTEGADIQGKLTRHPAEMQLAHHNLNGLLVNSQGLIGEDQTGSKNESASLLTRTNQVSVTDSHLLRQNMAFLDVNQTKTEGEASTYTVRYHSLIQDLQNILRMNMVQNKPGTLHQIKVKIHPQHLGEIDIQLTSLEGKLTIHLLASSRTALEALDRNLYQLQATLFQQGMQVDRIEVAQQTSGSHLFNYGQDHPQHQSGRQSGQNQPSQERGAPLGNPVRDSLYVTYEQDENVTLDYTV